MLANLGNKVILEKSNPLHAKYLRCNQSKMCPSVTVPEVLKLQMGCVLKMNL